MSEKGHQQALVPRLRFPDFRDSKGWQAPKIADIYRFKRTNTLSRDKLTYEVGVVKNIHYGDIHTKFKALFRVRDEDVPYVNPELPDVSFDDDAYCEEGDIVLADASEDLNDVGKAIEIISLDKQQLVSGTHTILATRREGNPVTGFGGYLFHAPAVRAGVQKEAQGAKVYGISAKRISSILLPLPEAPAEQQKIADCLGSLDDMIAAQGRKLATLRDYKKGLMQQLFPREGETLPRLRFPEFCNAPEWKEEKLDEITPAIFDGTHQTPTYAEDGVPFYSVENLISGSANKFISKSDYNLATKKNTPEKGDILLTRIGKIGFSQVVTWDHAFSVYVTLAVIKQSSEFESYYLHCLMQSEYYQSELRSKSLSTAVPPKINMDSLRETRVLLPCPAEQQRIADCFFTLDTLITAQAERLDTLHEHKRGLMQKLFPSPEDTAAATKMATAP